MEIFLEKSYNNNLSYKYKIVNNLFVRIIIIKYKNYIKIIIKYIIIMLIYKKKIQYYSSINNQYKLNKYISKMNKLGGFIENNPYNQKVEKTIDNQTIIKDIEHYVPLLNLKKNIGSNFLLTYKNYELLSPENESSSFNIYELYDNITLKKISIKYDDIIINSRKISIDNNKYNYHNFLESKIIYDSDMFNEIFTSINDLNYPYLYKLLTILYASDQDKYIIVPIIINYSNNIIVNYIFTYNVNIIFKGVYDINSFSQNIDQNIDQLIQFIHIVNDYKQKIIKPENIDITTWNNKLNNFQAEHILLDILIDKKYNLPDVVENKHLTDYIKFKIKDISQYELNDIAKTYKHYDDLLNKINLLESFNLLNNKNLSKKNYNKKILSEYEFYCNVYNYVVTRIDISEFLLSSWNYTKILQAENIHKTTNDLKRLNQAIIKSKEDIKNDIILKTTDILYLISKINIETECNFGNYVIANFVYDFINIDNIQFPINNQLLFNKFFSLKLLTSKEYEKFIELSKNQNDDLTAINQIIHDNKDIDEYYYWDETKVKSIVPSTSNNLNLLFNYIPGKNHFYLIPQTNDNKYDDIIFSDCGERTILNLLNYIFLQNDGSFKVPEYAFDQMIQFYNKYKNMNIMIKNLKACKNDWIKLISGQPEFIDPSNYMYSQGVCNINPNRENVIKIIKKVLNYKSNVTTISDILIECGLIDKENISEIENTVNKSVDLLIENVINFSFDISHAHTNFIVNKNEIYENMFNSNTLIYSKKNNIIMYYVHYNAIIQNNDVYKGFFYKIDNFKYFIHKFIESEHNTDSKRDMIIEILEDIYDVSSENTKTLRSPVLKYIITNNDFNNLDITSNHIIDFNKRYNIGETIKIDINLNAKIIVFNRIIKYFELIHDFDVNKNVNIFQLFDIYNDVLDDNYIEKCNNIDYQIHMGYSYYRIAFMIEKNYQSNYTLMLECMKNDMIQGNFKDIIKKYFSRLNKNNIKLLLINSIGNFYYDNKEIVNNIINELLNRV